MTAFAPRLAVVVACLLAGTAGRLTAQTSPPPPPNEYARSTELGVALGVASASAKTGAMLSGIVGWQFTRWVAVEGRGSWFDRGTGADAFAADLSAVLDVVPRQRVTPHVLAGVGFYRASFDSLTSTMTGFYRNRMDAAMFGPMGGTRASFTDPAFRLGGGVDIVTRRNLVLRPEAAALLVHHGSQTEAVGTFGIRFAYRFEDHPVTPSR